MQNPTFDGPIDPDRFYPGPFVDRLFSINASTRWRWRQRGVLAPVLIAGVPRYRGADLIALAEPRSPEVA